MLGTLGYPKWFSLEARWWFGTYCNNDADGYFVSQAATGLQLRTEPGLFGARVSSSRFRFAYTFVL